MLYFIMMLGLIFTINTMEQLSPRSRKVAQGTLEAFKQLCSDWGVNPHKHGAILKAMSHAHPKLTLDDCEPFRVSQKYKFSFDDPCQGISFSNEMLIKYAGGKIRKFNCVTRESKTIRYALPEIFQGDYKSDELFSYEAFDAQKNTRAIYIHRSKKIKHIDSQFGSRSSAPCFNADGSVLIYAKNAGSLSNASNHELGFYFCATEDLRTLEIDALNTQSTKPGLVIFAKLASNPVDATEMVCLSSMGTMYVIGIASGVPCIKKKFQAFTTVKWRNVLFNPTGRYLIATTHKTLKIWDRESNFENPEVLEVEHSILDIHFSPKGNCLAILTNKNVMFFSMSTKKFFTAFDCAIGEYIKIMSKGRSFMVGNSHETTIYTIR